MKRNSSNETRCSKRGKLIRWYSFTVYNISYRFRSKSLWMWVWLRRLIIVSVLFPTYRMSWRQWEDDAGSGYLIIILKVLQWQQLQGFRPLVATRVGLRFAERSGSQKRYSPCSLKLFINKLHSACPTHRDKQFALIGDCCNRVIRSLRKNHCYHNLNHKYKLFTSFIFCEVM